MLIPRTDQLAEVIQLWREVGAMYTGLGVPVAEQFHNPPAAPDVLRS